MVDIDLREHWENWEEEWEDSGEEKVEVYRLKTEETKVTLYFKESSFRIVVDVMEKGLIIKTPNIEYTDIYNGDPKNEEGSVSHVLQDNSTIVRIRDEVISRKME